MEIVRHFISGMRLSDFVFMKMSDNTIEVVGHLLDITISIFDLI